MLSTLISIHGFLVWLILIAGAVALVLGITLLVVRRGVADTDTPSSSVRSLTVVFRRSLIVAAALGALQALMGGLLYLAGARPGEPLHYVYGVIVLVAIPVAYAYSDQKQVRRDLIITVIALVAFIGAAVRAFMTGAPKLH